MIGTESVKGMVRMIQTIKNLIDVTEMVKCLVVATNLLVTEENHRE